MFTEDYIDVKKNPNKKITGIMQPSPNFTALMIFFFFIRSETFYFRNLFICINKF